MFLMGVIPLRRMDSRSQVQTLKRCMELVKNGGSVFSYPEGTRSKDGSLGAFKKGAFTITAKTGVTMVPITLTGIGKIMPSRMEERYYIKIEVKEGKLNVATLHMSDWNGGGTEEEVVDDIKVLIERPERQLLSCRVTIKKMLNQSIQELKRRNTL